MIMDYFNGNIRDEAMCNTLSHRRTIIDPDDVLLLRDQLNQISDGIEITITFLPELHNRYNSSTLTQLVKHFFTSIRLKGDTLDVILIGEFSATGFYHMHGIIKTSPRVINLVKRKINREIGRTELKMIKYVESYINYIFKDTQFQRKIYNDEIITL